MPEAQALAAAWSSGQEITDAQFDRIYPEAIQELSARHFTPVAVARRAAALLAPAAAARVLDVGAGVGKFCLVGALETGATFVGVEQQRRLVDVAIRTTRRFGVLRTQFVHADIAALDWHQFDAFYLFNPFYEHHGAREASVQLTETRLAAARPGTRVVTYHGFGGTMPRGYSRALREYCGSDVLELWIKQPAGDSIDDDITTVGRRSPRPRPAGPRLVLFVGAYDQTNNALAAALLLPEVQVVRVGTTALAQRLLDSQHVDGLVFGPDVVPAETMGLGRGALPRLAALDDDDPARIANLTAQGIGVVAATPSVLSSAVAAALRLPA